MRISRWAAIGLIFACSGYLQAKPLHNWHNVHAVMNDAVVVEMKVLTHSVYTDLRLEPYGHTVMLEGKILETGNAGVVLQITHMEGKPISLDANMLSILLGSRVKLVTGKSKEVAYAVAPILKPDIVRILKKNSKLKRWSAFGLIGKESAVYCPLPRTHESYVQSITDYSENPEKIYRAVE